MAPLAPSSARSRAAPTLLLLLLLLAGAPAQAAPVVPAAPAGVSAAGGAHVPLAASTSRWSVRKLFSGLSSRTRIVQFCVVVMCLALFILMRR
jgi:hypothetical protein